VCLVYPCSGYGGGREGGLFWGLGLELAGVFGESVRVRGVWLDLNNACILVVCF
jgi:hypothetical protein